MKRLLRATLAFVAILTFAGLQIGHGSVGSLGATVAGADAAVEQNVYCKDGFNGYTTDPAAFCKAHGGTADVSSGNYPFKCADGKVKSGPDATTACANNGGSAAASTPTSGCVKLSIPIFAGNDCIDNTAPGGAIVAYLKQILKLLSLAVGAVIMLMLVIAGIQYITSVGLPEQIKAAKTRIINAITALILFLMTYAIINFLIPGGLFS